MFTGRLDALPDSFRVACFRARRSTHVTVFYTFHLARGVGLETYLVVINVVTITGYPVKVSRSPYPDDCALFEDV
jgi:hypothetical protein